MKNLVFGFAVTAAGLVACNGNNNSTPDNHQTGDRPMMDSGMHNMDNATGKNQPGNPTDKQIEPVLAAYFNLKNALANDDANKAAIAGKAVTSAVENVDAASLSGEQKKMFDEVKDDMKEHGEHISENAGKIAHQREHFEILSKDMYDLAKVFNNGKTMYYANCPMYNNNKGGDWLSEVKEIRNPYLGKKMPTCGTIKEELK